jgi:hypothetical protein
MKFTGRVTGVSSRTVDRPDGSQRTYTNVYLVDTETGNKCRAYYPGQQSDVAPLRGRKIVAEVGVEDREVKPNEYRTSVTLVSVESVEAPAVPVLDEPQLAAVR